MNDVSMFSCSHLSSITGSFRALATSSQSHGHTTKWSSPPRKSKRPQLVLNCCPLNIQLCMPNIHISTHDSLNAPFHSAVWKTWKVQSSSCIQRTTTSFHFLLLSRYLIYHSVHNDRNQLNWCFPRNYKWRSHTFQHHFLFQVGWTYFAHLLQMYEVAASAQNAERVKLEPFDGSKGYLHNGLYRDRKLPTVLKWEHISLIILKPTIL